MLPHPQPLVKSRGQGLPTRSGRVSGNPRQGYGAGIGNVLVFLRLVCYGGLPRCSGLPLCRRRGLPLCRGGLRLCSLRAGIRAWACARGRARARACTGGRTGAGACPRTRTCTGAHACAGGRMHACTHARERTRTWAGACLGGRMHMPACGRTCTGACTHVGARAHVRGRVHVRSGVTGWRRRRIRRYVLPNRAIVTHLTGR